MKTNLLRRWTWSDAPLFKRLLQTTFLLAFAGAAFAQTLLNIDFGVGTASQKTGPAAAGLGSNDFWNLYRHYSPRFTPGMPLVPDGRLDGLKLADGSPSPVSITVSNAPGVWANASGDPMFDTYIFAQNGSNVLATLSGLAPGRYYFYLYGHADPDVTGEQNSAFTLRVGTNVFGPLVQMGASGWKATNAWAERAQFVVFRDISVEDKPVVIEAAPGPNGVAVLNGLQILSRGTSPPRLLLPLAVAPLIASNPPPFSSNLLVREICYEGTLADTEARFTVSFEAESGTTNEISAPLFEGDVALLDPKVPSGLRIVSSARQSRLIATKPGVYPVKLELVARITRKEPWNEISFVGPQAAVAAVQVQAAQPGVEVQLQSGTALAPPSDKERKPGPGAAPARLSGWLGADRVLALRWQSKATEVVRKSLVTVDTAASAVASPTVVKYTTVLRYEILQSSLPSLAILLPANQALTRIQGDQIRDWQIQPGSGTGVAPAGQVLKVEFIKPVEKAASLTLYSEQTIDSTPAALVLIPPQPLDIEREAGTFSVSADDTLVEIEPAPALRQINAPAGALAAYRFNSRPFTLAARLQRIEPVLKASDRVTARLEENRLLVSHALNLAVEKAGIYALDLTPQLGFVVSDVRGEGIDDWKATDGRLRVSFSARVLGSRRLDVQLEQAQKQFPDAITVLPLGIGGATNVTVQVGASSSPGIRLKTGELAGLREMPVTALRERTDELLAFIGEQPEWKLALGAEKLPARVVAEVFNLVTVGDGLVGGSATIRYGIFNQGVRDFRVALPSHWKNVEFTGANIRRKEAVPAARPAGGGPGQPPGTNLVLWAISLQDKAWGGYTLVITYDYQFDPKGATLDLAGAHPLDVERESGSLGLMTAASLKLTPTPPRGTLRAVDESELSESDRALCTRPLLLAYKYTGPDYTHSVQAARFEELQVLEAVADRIEMTTVLTEEGQMLTQASFMVKNNEKQFQQFKLPRGAEFWSSFVNGQPAKPERDGEWLLLPLPRDANRDQAFAVDLVYAQTVDIKTAWFPRRMVLAAPLTDIRNTYAEWQLFVPVSQRLGAFEGNMAVARGTTYELRDAWQEFVQFYGNLIENHLGLIAAGLALGVLMLLVVAAIRRGLQGAVTVVVVLAILAVLAGMMLPALARAKAKAQRVSSISNLKQIGLAARIWSNDNGDRFPGSLEAMRNELGSEKVTTDPNTGQRFVYVGAGKDGSHPEAILAYSPSDLNGRAVLFADGSVQVMTAEKFQEALQRDASVPRAVVSANAPTMPGVGVAELAQQAAPVLPAQSAQPSAAVRRVRPPAAPGMGGGAEPGTAPASLGAVPPGGRPMRIDVPRTGQAFSFTKVLNAGRAPLTVSVSLMRLKIYREFLMVLQVSAFVVGLILLWWLARRPQPSDFFMTVGIVLILGALASLLALWRLLGAGLIAAVLLVLLALGWGARRYWRRWVARPQPTVAPDQPPPVDSGSGPATAAALIAFLALIGVASSQGADDKAAAARPSASGPSNPVSILSAAYNGSVQEKVAQFDAAISLSSVGTNLFVPLFGDDVAVREFKATGEAKVVRDGRLVGVVVPQPAELTLQFKLVVHLGGDVTRRTLAFGIPPALASRVNLLLDEAEADVEFPTAVAFSRAGTNQQTRIEAVLGASDRLEMNWTPRVKRAAEIAATVFAQNTSLATLANGVMNVRAGFDYQISQGELKQVRIAIPSGQRLLRVEGEGIRTWEIKPGSAQPGGPEETVVVDLVKGMTPAYKLTLETERVLDKLPATARVEIPHALDVKRETGLVALRGGEELALTLEEAGGLQRVDAEEFHRSMPDRKDGLMSAFRFLKPDFVLRVRAEAIQAQLEAVVKNNVRIGAENLRLDVQVDYTIKRAGVFALRLLLPPEYRLDAVTGANVFQHLERSEAGRRIVEVTLRQRTLGTFVLNLSLTQTYKEPPRTLAIAGIHPLGVEKLSGFFAVTADPGIAVKTATFDGLTEVPFASVIPERPSSGGGALAYKFIAAQPGPQPAWSLSVTTEAVEPWLRAEVASIVTVTETLVSGRVLLKYEVANAPVKEFRLRVPAAFRNVEISGPQIRRRDQTGEEWRVELQGKVRGDYLLTVAWEVPKSEQTNRVVLAGVHAAGVERETGFVSVVARPPLQVADQSAKDLLSRIDVRELPEWMGRPDAATVLAYRYLRPGYVVALEARRYDEAQVLQALIDGLRLTTVVADDGQMMTELSLNIHNHGRQHLEIELPERSEVWSAFVAGEPVRPSLRQGKLLLPLERSVASDAPIAIELTFIGLDPFPKKRGPVALASPRFDAPVKNARWELYLPPDYEYSRFEGSMNRAADQPLPQAQVYSLAEYNVQQRAQEEQAKADVRNELKVARDNLKGGNLRQAIGGYNRSKSKGQQFRDEAEENRDLKEIAKDVRRAQSSNLIGAQNSLFYENVSRLADQQFVQMPAVNPPAQGQAAAQNQPALGILNYDAEVAGQQWDKLEKAQQVTVAKVAPLRVNLPTRGVRFSFAQVLQTEVRKPMTVRLLAENTRVPAWGGRLLLAATGFLALWALVAWLNRRAAKTSL